jgi:hypothetical protein
MNELKVDSSINIVQSILEKGSKPSCRIYHCYREWDHLICKPIPFPDTRLHEPYTDVMCVKQSIPQALDPMILAYKCIPRHVSINGS